jgi:hypothetical protein
MTTSKTTTGWLMTVELRAESARAAADARTFYRELMNALEELDVLDADLHGELCRGPVTVSVGILDEDLNDAICHAMTAVRTAIHSAGASTPNWPHCDDLQPEPDGEGGWIVTYVSSSQQPQLISA